MATNDISSGKIDHPSASDTIYHLGFNQDSSCLIVGTEKGYKIFNWETLDKVKLVCDNEVGEVTIAERLFSSSLMAVVCMKTPRNMKLSHLRKNQQICDYLFPNCVLGVKLSRKRIIVCLEFRIIIHSVSDLKVAHEINNTPSNPKGLFAVSTCQTNTLVAYPGSKTEGLVQIFDAIHLQASSLIRAHDSPLAALAFNDAGTLLATASEKGTVIRIFNVQTGQKIQELRRGLKRNAEINSLSFAMDSTVLVVSSNTETVHIFKVADQNPAPVTVDDTSVMGWLSSAVSTSATYLPTPMTDMLQQERAYAIVTLPFTNIKNVTTITLIENQPYVLVASVDGYLYIYNLNLVEGGECTLVKQQKLNFASPTVEPEDDISPKKANYASALKGVSASAPLTETEKIKVVTDAVETLDIAPRSDDDTNFPPFNPQCSMQEQLKDAPLIL